MYTNLLLIDKLFSIDEKKVCSQRNSENEIIDALKVAHEAIKKMCELQLKLSKLVGISDKREYCHEDEDEDLLKDISSKTFDKIYKVGFK